MSHAQRQRPAVTLAVLALGAMAYSLLQSGVAPALPNIQRSLHTSENGASWVFTAYLLSASVGTPILGRLGDMYGKEKYLLYPWEKVPGAIGLSAILGIGGGLGVVAAGVIVKDLDYHWLFWIPLVAIVAAAILTWRLVPESPVRVPGRINWIAPLLMGTGLSAVLIAVSETIQWGWGSARTLGLIVAGLVFLTAWVAVEVRSKDPLVDMKMMSLRGVWTTNLAAFLLGAGMYSTSSSCRSSSRRRRATASASARRSPAAGCSSCRPRSR